MCFVVVVVVDTYNGTNLYWNRLELIISQVYCFQTGHHMQLGQMCEFVIVGDQCILPYYQSQIDNSGRVQEGERVIIWCTSRC